MFSAVPLKKWCLIFSSAYKKVTVEFVDMLQTVGRKMNYDITLPITNEISTNSIDNLVLALYDSLNEKPDLIMCVLPSFQANQYSNIKTRCADNAIPSKVVLAKFITPRTNGPNAFLATFALKVIN